MYLRQPGQVAELYGSRRKGDLITDPLRFSFRVMSKFLAKTTCGWLFHAIQEYYDKCCVTRIMPPIRLRHAAKGFIRITPSEVENNRRTIIFPVITPVTTDKHVIQMIFNNEASPHITPEIG